MRTPAAPTTPAGAEPRQSPADTQGTLVLDFAHRPPSKQELDAARNCVAGSKHTRLTLLPNHALDPTGELEGFVFECCADDPASVLPLTRSTFATTAVYECMADSSVFLRISSDTACATAQLLEPLVFGALEHVFKLFNSYFFGSLYPLAFVVPPIIIDIQFAVVGIARQDFCYIFATCPSSF
jgi:hypothetical protein